MMRCAKFKAIIVNQGTTSKPLDACKAGTASHVYTKSSQVGLRSWSQCANSNSSMPWRFWAHPRPAGWLNVELICTQLILSHGLWNLHNSLSWGLNLKLMSLTTRVVACLWPQDAKKSGCAHVRLCWYLTMELDCNFMVIYAWFGATAVDSTFCRDLGARFRAWWADLWTRHGFGGKISWGVWAWILREIAWSHEMRAWFTVKFVNFEFLGFL